MRLCSDPAEADDLLQDTFERALRAGDGEALQNPRAWLVTVMNNVFRDRCRRDNRRPHLVPIDERTEIPQPDSNPEPEPDWMSITSAQLEAALSRLEEPFRRVYELYTFENASYEQIAHTLGVPKSTVGTRITRARQKIQAFLCAQLEDSRTPLIKEHGNAV